MLQVCYTKKTLSTSNERRHDRIPELERKDFSKNNFSFTLLFADVINKKKSPFLHFENLMYRSLVEKQFSLGNYSNKQTIERILYLESTQLHDEIE